MNYKIRISTIWSINTKLSYSIYELIDSDRKNIFILKLLFIELIGASITHLSVILLDGKAGGLQVDLHSLTDLAFVTIIGPIMEEIGFRLWIDKKTLLLSSLLFGLAHSTNYTFTEFWTLPLLITACCSQFSSGFVFGMVRIKFGLIHSILLHCLVNSTILLIIKIYRG